MLSIISCSSRTPRFIVSSSNYVRYFPNLLIFPIFLHTYLIMHQTSRVTCSAWGIYNTRCKFQSPLLSPSPLQSPIPLQSPSPLWGYPTRTYALTFHICLPSFSPDSQGPCLQKPQLHLDLLPDTW